MTFFESTQCFFDERSVDADSVGGPQAGTALAVRRRVLANIVKGEDQQNIMDCRLRLVKIAHAYRVCFDR